MSYATRRRRRQENPALVTLIAVAILASILSFRWFGPLSSSSAPIECGDACNVSAAAPEVSIPVAPPAIEPQPNVIGGPYVSAKAAVVVDGECGDVIYGKSEHLRLAPASLTKIVAAIVARETADPDNVVNVNLDGFYYGDSTVMGLETGMKLTLRDLLYGLLLPSGNDAAVAIARHVAGDVPAFVSRMNAKVRELGLQDTHFTNPHGLDAPAHYSSAYDMAMLGRYALRDPLLAEIVKTKTAYPNWQGGELWNGNLLLWLYPGADGVKIGWTEKAGQSMIATAQRNGRRVFVALLNSQDRYTDAIGLLDWAFEESTWAASPGAGCRGGF